MKEDYIDKIDSKEFFSLIKKQIQVSTNYSVVKMLSDMHMGKSGDTLDCLIRYSPNGLVIADSDGNILNANNNFLKIFGLSEDFIGENKVNLFLLLFPDERMKINRFFKVLFEERKVEMTFQSKLTNGETKFFEFQTYFNPKLHRYITIVRDRTAQLIKESESKHKDSLVSLGEMAAGIAHEIRNPLTCLKGFTKLLESNIKEDGLNYLNIIESEITRIECILNEFLMLSKPKVLENKVCSMKNILQPIVQVMEPQAKMNNVEIELNINSFEEKIVFVDEHEIKKVIMNVIRNAIEAMMDGGVIQITQTIRDDRYLKVSIQDNGIGMNKETLDKIFNTFFTTKKTGTGFGLAHAFQTMKNHNGKIEVESKEGVGSVFHLFFPFSSVEGKHIISQLQKK